MAAHVGVLPPAPHDSDADSSSSSDNSGDGAAISLEVGDHLGNDDYLLTVRRVLSGSTQLVVHVVKSQGHHFAVGMERIISMTRAHELYRQYNDL